jgi:flagellar hook-associated protein 3 FlgL
MRITDNLLARAVLNGSSRALARIANAQARIASGKNLLRPSDDPLALAKVLGLKSELSRIDAHTENASTAVAFMALTEGSLQEVSDLLSRAKELVLSGMNATTDGTGADSQATELESMIDALLQVANRDSAGRSIFGGQRTTSPPYERVSGGVVYRGDSEDLLEELGRGLRVAMNLTGPNAFETVPARMESLEDLDPALSTITPLADLFDGDGIATGRIRVTDSNGVSADLDLLAATSIGDVIDAVNNAGLSVVASLDPEREAIVLTDVGGGATLTVEDLDGGTFAQGLGLATTSDTGAIEGLDLDPALTESTPAALLLRGAGIGPGTWTIRTRKDDVTLEATIDPSAANTVGDLLRMIEDARTAGGESLGLRASIEGKGLSIESTRLHTRISISDDASPGSAENLGLAGGGEPRDIFALLVDAARAVRSRETGEMDDAIRDLTRAIEGTAGMRGAYGARARQVIQLHSRLQDESVDMTIRLADLEDVDLAKASLDLAHAENTYNAALSAGSRLYAQNLFDYIR